MASNSISVAALTDALIVMAVGMTLTRTIGLAGRAARLPEAAGAGTPAAAPVPDQARS
jgi:hypothetical protein